MERVPNTGHGFTMSATTHDLVADAEAQHTRTAETELPEGREAADIGCIFVTDM